MVRSSRPVVALILLAACMLSGCGYEEKGARIEKAITEDVQPIAGVATVSPSVNANTSGTFIAVKITAASSDEADMKRILEESLKAVLKDPRLGDGGTFGMSVFSPGDATSVGPSDLGYAGTSSTSDLREFFG